MWLSTYPPTYLTVHMLHHKEVFVVAVIHKGQCDIRESSVALEPDQERNHNIQSMMPASQTRYTHPVKTFGTCRMMCWTKLCDDIHFVGKVEDGLSSSSQLQLTNVGLLNEIPVTNNIYFDYISIKFFFIRTHTNPPTPFVLKMKGRKHYPVSVMNLSQVFLTFWEHVFLLEPDHD